MLLAFVYQQPFFVKGNNENKIHYLNGESNYPCQTNGPSFLF